VIRLTPETHLLPRLPRRYGVTKLAAILWLTDASLDGQIAVAGRAANLDALRASLQLTRLEASGKTPITDPVLAAHEWGMLLACPS